MTAGVRRRAARPARGVPAPAAAQRRMLGRGPAGAGCAGRPHRRNRIDREAFQADRGVVSKGMRRLIRVI